MRVGAPDGGRFLQLVEEEFRAMFGTSYAVALNSATSGLHAALTGVGVGPGDLVMVPGVTMTASASAVIHAGATPILVDVDPSIGISLAPQYREAYAYAESEHGKSPIAAVVVHLFGQTADVSGLANEVRVVEDCAQAPACVTDTGVLAGTMGDVGVFSLNQDKAITCGEGGVCITDSGEAYDLMRLMRNHGENSSPSICGYNYRLTELEAAVAYAEVAELFARQRVRLALAQYMAAELGDQERFQPMEVENAPYQFYMIDHDPNGPAPPKPWHRHYSTPLCCIPYFKANLGQGCLVRAHEFNSKMVCTKSPSCLGEADVLIRSILDKK